LPECDASVVKEVKTEIVGSVGCHFSCIKIRSSA
jgi:hypothetical protein